jgi:hypothetical protein
MSHPSTAREVLLTEAIADVVELLKSADEVCTRLATASAGLQQADANLREQLAAFEGRMTAIAETAKTFAVKHIATRADEAARRVIDVQTRAMTDAARVAFGAEAGAMLQRAQGPRVPPVEPPCLWEQWLVHAATAAAASAVTYLVVAARCIA